MPDEFVAIDLETTGLSLEDDRITEVGATRFDRAGRVETFHFLINPGRSIPREIQELTAITDAAVANAPPFSAVAARLTEFLGDRPLVGQNVQFDVSFLTAEGVRLGGRSYDTWELASVLLPTAQRLNLESLAALLGIAMPVAHRALSDAEATRDVFLALLDRLDRLPRSLLLELRTFAERAHWGVIDLIDDALAVAGDVRGDPQAAARLAADAASIVAALASPPVPAAMPALQPADARRPVTAADVASLFLAAADRGELLPGYEPRPGQQAMAEAVRRTLEHGGQLAAEAGTGTGKSLAYLLPTALNALRNGERVVVSTHTRNLQEQLAGREIPLAAALVEAHEGAPPGALRATLLKGRSNYLCLERWAGVRADPRARSEAEARLFGRVATWLPETTTGDLSELYMTSAEEPAWAQISADGTDCLARRCAFVRDGSCFLLRSRQRAAAAHVVVVNHALLLANAARDDQVLPPFPHLVLDEAHRMEDVATSHYGASLSLRELRDLVEGAGSADRHGRPGIAQRLHAAPRGGQLLSPAAGLAPVAELLGSAVSGGRELVPALGDAARRFAHEYAEEEGPRSEVALSAARRAQPAWEEVEESALQVDLALQVIGERLGRVRDALAAVPPGSVAELDALRADTAGALDACAVARDTLRRVVLRPHREDIAWLSTADGDVRFSLAPLEVADHLAADLYAGRRSVVATSATLTAGGSFDFSVQRLGLDEPETLQVPSPFDYRSAVLVLLVNDLPEPGMPGYDVGLQDALFEAALGAGGRTLALFTSHGSLRQAASGLRDRLSAEDVMVLAQGADGSPTRLLRLLAARPRTLVLGTAAFWEGIDVPGDALSQIVIARLPFPVPTDPIYAGRAAQFDDPFGEFAVPQAVLRFRQGFGRLIRSAHDRGVFVVLDSRIVRRAYGEAFLEALPDCEVRRLRSDLVADAVAEWLAR